MWNRTHTIQSGGYVEGTYPQEFMVYQSIKLETIIIMIIVIAYFINTFVLLQDIVISTVDERLRDLKQPREVIEIELFNEMMYQEDKTNQRVVGYGYGVTRSHIFGIEAELRKSKMGDYAGTSSDVMGLKSYLLFVERKNDEVMRKNDEVISQLQKRNDKVISQLLEKN